MGHASLNSHKKSQKWHEECSTIKNAALNAFANMDHMIYGDLENTLPNTLSISFADIHAEALIICLKDVAEISTGSACTSASYSPSHVLTAMGLDEVEANRVVRFSWSPRTNSDVWNKIAERIEILL